MKIMITGGSGQLGYDCGKVLGDSFDILLAGREDLDITAHLEVDKKVREYAPDVIINCAAYTLVDNCETQKKLAFEVNVKGPENLAKSIEKHGGKLIHISTDYVFDGKRKVPDPYVEDDKPAPVSSYGMTKLESEHAVRQYTQNHIILRTAWLYGINGHNFLKTMLKLALTMPGKEIKVVNDQFGSPTWSYRLALQIAKLLEKDNRGTFHATSEGYCSWYELACYFLKKMEISHGIVPCTTEQYRLPAPRPHNSILENRNLEKSGINVMESWKTDMDQFILKSRQMLMDEIKSPTIPA